MRRTFRWAASLVCALVCCAVAAAGPAARGAVPPRPVAAAVATEEKPRITLSREEAGAGARLTVRGTGWRPDTLLTLLVCGQRAIGGTNACANAEGRAVTTDADGGFRKRIPVAEPPKPCPCVVRASTVTGAHAAANAAFRVAGHPVAPLPEKRTGGRISVLAARLEGDSGLLNWFGAPERRKLVLTVGNVGSDRTRDPVFEVGSAHGVLAPEWERQRWRGTIGPGRKARVELTVELAAGAHGAYTVAARRDGRVLTEQPWDVGRPWGVTLFWVLLCLVVPLLVFRSGMLLVDRVRPRRAAPPAEGPTGAADTSRGLPWFTPDAVAAPPPAGPGAAAPFPDEREPEQPSGRSAGGPYGRAAEERYGRDAGAGSGDGPVERQG
ncbi:neocarzinostatin apoprotein domain-containing protein [Streptomyces qinglanensis]|uniref:neocarzinostatin apoprotein domain-containing protein n=1 Tax=Streptomyces qinglanensis TaxID=943816 RepID=UPI0037890B08